MTILTFNIRNGLANDGVNSWVHRRELTADAIKATSADIIGLQEVYDFQLRYLLAKLPNYRCYSVGREDGASQGEQCSILWRTDALHRVKAGTFWLSDTPEIPNSKSWGNRITRICSWVEFKEGFRFYNTHWDHESQNARIRSAELTLQVLPESRWIFAGDFNAEPDSPELHILANTKTVDFATCNNPIGTFHNFNGGINGDRIDHILVSKGITPGHTEVITNFQGSIYPSDHYPLVIKVTL